MATMVKNRKYQLEGWPGYFVELADGGLKVTRDGTDVVEWPLVDMGNVPKEVKGSKMKYLAEGDDPE